MLQLVDEVLGKTASSESKLIFGVAEGFCRAFGVGIVFLSSFTTAKLTLAANWKEAECLSINK